MADRPIIFSASMVRALLDGRKSQTRRILKLPSKAGGHPIYERRDMGGWEPTTIGGGSCFFIGKSGEHISAPEEVAIWHRTCGVCIAAPYQIGDRLWVREAWAPLSALTHNDPGALALAQNGFYRADNGTTDGEISRWRPSTHMPRWASRLTLAVTRVRVERLQDISDDDAIAEGIERRLVECADGQERGLWFGIPQCGDTSPVNAFTTMWDSLHNPRGLCADDNPNGSVASPWIVALTFIVAKRNIDAPEAE